VQAGKTISTLKTLLCAVFLGLSLSISNIYAVEVDAGHSTSENLAVEESQNNDAVSESDPKNLFQVNPVDDDQAEVAPDDSFAPESSDSLLLEEISFLEPIKRDLPWHISGVSSILLFTYLSMDNAGQYKDLEAENELLKSEYENAILQLDMKKFREQIAENESEMDEKSRSSEIYNSLLLLGIVTESVLLYLSYRVSEPEEDAAIELGNNHNFHITPFFSSSELKAGFGFRWRW